MQQLTRMTSLLLFLMLAMRTTIFAQQGNKTHTLQADQHQNLPASFTDPVTGMEFVLIKGGCYMMGDTFRNHSPSAELPAHEVCVDDFYLGKYHVTNEQFKKFCDATSMSYRTTAEKQGTGYSFTTDKPNDGTTNWLRGVNWLHPIWPGDKIERKMNHPVVQVSWYDAKAFAKWLKRKTGRNYRLAYESEYEYAIRNGGKNQKFAWGDGTISGNVADISLKRIFTQTKKNRIFEGYDDGYAFTSPVGSFKPNELGLYDMTGNVFSWVEDWFSQDYYQRSPKNNPHGSVMGASKVARGGSWFMNPWMDRASCRYEIPPDTRMFDIGFRLALPAQ